MKKIIFLIIIFSFFPLDSINSQTLKKYSPNDSTLAASDVKNIGQISDSRKITGRLLGTFFGYGIGHAVLGKWLEKGWIFTALETTSSIIIWNGLSSRDFSTPVKTAFFLGGGVRFWEIIDVWTLDLQDNNNNRHSENTKYQVIPYFQNGTGYLVLNVEFTF